MANSIVQPVQNRTAAKQNPPAVAMALPTAIAPNTPDFSDDPNYTGTPYVINFPAMTGDVAQSLAAMRSLRLSIIMAGPKPHYSVHGEMYDWEGLMTWFNRSMVELTKELIALQPSDLRIGAMR